MADAGDEAPQLTCKFVTKLPEEFRVPQAALVSVGGCVSYLDCLNAGLHACASSLKLSSFECSPADCAVEPHSLWPLPNHQSPA